MQAFSSFDCLNEYLASIHSTVQDIFIEDMRLNIIRIFLSFIGIVDLLYVSLSIYLPCKFVSVSHPVWHYPAFKRKASMLYLRDSIKHNKNGNYNG